MGKRAAILGIVVVLVTLMAPGVASADESRCPVGVGDVPSGTNLGQVDWAGVDASYTYDPFWGYHIVDTDACVETSYYFVTTHEVGVVAGADAWLSIYQKSCIFVDAEVSPTGTSYWDAVCAPTGTAP